MDFLDLIFPKRCISCKKFGSFFCQKCLSQLKEITDVCPVCEKPAITGETHKYCQTKYSLNGLVSIYDYDFLIKKALHRFKYAPYLQGLAEIFVKLMVKNLDFEKGITYFLKDRPVFVPIPLHWYRKHLRGFNQAQLLAKGLAKTYNLPLCDLLKRKKMTKPQSNLTFKERKQNVVDIFAINEKYQNKIPSKVIIVDDLWTTGSTLKNACQILKKSKVEKVWALTLAR